MNKAELDATLLKSANAFDFFQALRRIEAAFPEKPRLGESGRPADEPVRLGQEPTLAFAPTAIAGYLPGREGGPRRLMVRFLGLLGPNGPLPLHLTEYVRERTRHSNPDPTMARFLDVFHHRMLSLFYRAWANSQPTVQRDRPQSDRFTTYVGALIGMAMPGLQKRDRFPDVAKLFYAGRLAAQTRNAEGLQAMVGDFFKMPAAVEEFIGTWVDLPGSERWSLNGGPGGIPLGLSTNLGARVWQRQTKFRVTLGPLQRKQFQSMLPEGEQLGVLTALVKNYVGEQLDWDLRLILDEKTDQPFKLGAARMGWDAWLGRCPDGKGRQDLIFHPNSLATRQAAAA
jgi:type VI secretion system protein ImpH